MDILEAILSAQSTEPFMVFTPEEVGISNGTGGFTFTPLRQGRDFALSRRVTVKS